MRSSFRSPLPVCGELLILTERENEVQTANGRETVRIPFRMMRLLFPLLGHLLVTLVLLASPGGVRAVVAESLAKGERQFRSSPLQ